MQYDDYILLSQLLEGYRTGTLSDAEQKDLRQRAAVSPELTELMNRLTDDQQLDALLQTYFAQRSRMASSLATSVPELRASLAGQVPNLNQQGVKPVHRIHFLKTAWFRWAAAIIILFGTGTYIFTHTSQPDKEMVIDQPSPKSNDILPGYNRAVLTLSGGQKVELDSATSGTITDQTLSIENNRGELIYKNNDLVVTNTMTTPKGGQYQLTLADGTRVWLNAASSITYPTAFTGKNREVLITGEAYFEVAQNKLKPFIVNAGKEKIHVLGTSFNVSTYSDDDYQKISLIKGKIKIGQSLLQPSQAYINGKVVPTNLAQDLAWKNGYFNFQNIKLEEAMRQVSRWYDVEVKYAAQTPDIEFGGRMGRNLSLMQVLNSLKLMGVTFKLEGKTIMVGP